MSAFASGTRLGPYEIQSVLGAGGMGEVYRVRDTRVDRVDALKVLRESFAADPQRRARFDQEARLISQLNHEHICRLYNVGRDAGIDYLVMEFIEGETLGNRLARGPLPLEQAIRYAIQIAGALDAAHRHGIVHRDLKPANVMLTKAGVKLLDFGIAKIADSSAFPSTTAATLTAEGTLLGTPHYMSPEQLGGLEADARSDLFAFGAVLYEMLTGKRAFSGENQSQVVAAVLDSDPPPIAATQPLASPLLQHLVITCLAKDPDDRWQSAADVKRQLEWIAGSWKLPVSVPVARRRVPVAAYLAVGGLLAAIAAATAWWIVDRRQTAPLRETRLEISTPPTAISRQTSLAISPDGLTVVFVAESQGQSALWLRPLNGAARPLEGTNGAELPFWSPDGRSLGFFADGKLKRIEIAGSAAQVLADALDPQGGTWAMDGTILFTPHQLSPLLRVAAAGGASVAVTRLTPGQTGHLHPQALTDGLHVLYFATGPSELQGVYICRIDGSTPKLLLKGNSAAIEASTGYLLFLREDVLVAKRLDLTRLGLTGDAVIVADRVAVGSTFVPAASASKRGDVIYRGVQPGSAYQLTWFDRSGRILKQLGGADRAATGTAMSLSPDGHRVAETRQLGAQTDIWLLDVDRSGAMSRLTVSGTEANPLWTRDGQRVAYTSTRNGGIDIYQRAVDSGREEPLLVRPQQKIVPSEWSPDGQVLLYLNANPNTHLDIWALPMTGERTPFPVVTSNFEDINPQFGPDGTWIVYQSTISNRDELYVRPFGAGAEVPITTDGATQPRLRRDGKEVFYLGLDRWLMAMPIEVSANARSVKAGTPVRLFQTAIGGPVSGYQQRQYDVTPDGEKFLFDVPVEQSSTPIVLIQNWRP